MKKKRILLAVLVSLNISGGGYAKLIKYWHSMNAIISHTLNI